MPRKKTANTEIKTTIIAKPSLKSAFQDHFTIGAALGATHSDKENPTDSSLFKGITHLRCTKVTQIHYREDGHIETINPYRDYNF